MPLSSIEDQYCRDGKQEYPWHEPKNSQSLIALPNTGEAHAPIAKYMITESFFIVILISFPAKVQHFFLLLPSILDGMRLHIKVDTHLNDWQTAMAAALLKLQYEKLPLYSGIKSVLTIHNLKFQGVFDRGFCDELLSLGEPAFNIKKLEFYGSVNYLKGGLVYADKLTTVSPHMLRR